jgi:hypothetical protein
MPRTELNSNGQPQNENHSSGNKLEGLEGDRARSEGPAVDPQPPRDDFRL